jgi:hypothetical protein
MAVAVPSMTYSVLKSYVDRKTVFWNAYMLPLISNVGTISVTLQTADLAINWHHYNETIE